VASWLISRNPVNQAQKIRIILKGIYNMLGNSNKLLRWITALLNVVFISVNGMKHLRGHRDIILIIDYFS